MNDIICRCGHERENHPGEHPTIKFQVCNDCFMRNLRANQGLNGIKNSCPKYIPDNLTHIEMLAAQRGLV